MVINKKTTHVDHIFTVAVASYLLRAEISDSLKYTPLGLLIRRNSASAFGLAECLKRQKLQGDVE